MFQAVHQGTAYRFALKVIEAREAWIDDNDAEQIIRQAPYQCQTARAVDRFCGIVAAAGVMHGQQASTLAAHMIGDVADQVHEVDTALEVQIMVEEDDDYKVKSEEGGGDLLPPPAIHHTELNSQQPVADAGGDEETGVAEGGLEDEEMVDADAGGYGDFLAKLAQEDAENAEEEDMMELE